MIDQEKADEGPEALAWPSVDVSTGECVVVEVEVEVEVDVVGFYVVVIVGVCVGVVGF